MRLAYWLRDNGACGYYRVTMPLKTVLKNDKSLKLLEVIQGCGTDHVNKALEADITLIPRIGEPRILQMYEELQDEGMKLVTDFDDDVFNVSPLSPHYQEHGVEEIRMNIGGKMKDVWIDGENLNIKKNIQRMDTVKRACEKADMMTVTTDILADVYRQYNDNIKVLPNCIDTDLWQRLPFKDTEEVRLVWFGGHSHYEDWLVVSEAIKIVLGKYKNAKLVLMGSKWDKLLEGIRKEQIEFHSWVHTEAYPLKAMILNPDIAVIPLADNPFNKCKSSIKWIEMASLKTPAVSSLVSPYKEMMEGDNGLFVEENCTDAWVEALSYLIENKDRRIEVGNEARRYVEKNYDINTQWVQWQKAYNELMPERQLH